MTRRPAFPSTLALALGGLALACGATMPQELRDARAAYQRAANGPAAEFAPADLHTAEETLAVAERSFEQNGDSDETKDIAYAAERRAEIAEMRGSTGALMKQRADTLAQIENLRKNQVTTTAAELNRTREQLTQQTQALASEQARRQEAEKRAAQASADLARIAQVKQEPRGLVITLSGGVLFSSAKSDLLPQAQAKLSEVADALVKQDPDSKIDVIGYTDAQGGRDFNQKLSQDRADAVRDYLVKHGIATDRITATGRGSDMPIADNASAEGRANNRRVEIVVKPATHGSTTGTEPTPKTPTTPPQAPPRP
jgi:outer membrane protein OmpA-like peptidoglycan-associated protein